MAYPSRSGRRPAEYASKSAHGWVVSDPTVQAFLSQCNIPKKAEEIDIPEDHILTYSSVTDNPIRHVVAIDSGYEEIPVQEAYPSALLTFFQFGALVFAIEDLDSLENVPFIDPEDMAKLKNIQRLKFAMPEKNISLKGQTTLTHSVRTSIHDFFNHPLDGDEPLVHTLRWFIFQEYAKGATAWTLGSCPHCARASIPLHRNAMTKEHTFQCPMCQHEIFLTDVFRLHEAIDDELGAGGILGYVTTSFEQMLMIHVIRLVLELKPALLRSMLFIKDGPLAFFGQTANMYKPMRQLVRHLFASHDLYLAGLEKSGPFVDHADAIASRLSPGTVLLLDNDYIYKYIIPGKADPNNPYGRSTYYGSKLIFKTPAGRIHVASLPTTDVLLNPKATDIHNLDAVLTNIEKLRCDMYDNALLPIALANKLVSLAQVPSARILQRFATTAMHN